MNKNHLLVSLKSNSFSEKIVRAFEKVPREKFISNIYKSLAYEDIALPLEKRATISQPYTIAFMLNLLELKPKQKILEIGSGSGYVLALMAEISPKNEIHGIEIIKSLAAKSRGYLKGYPNIKVISKNGFNGIPNQAPFDRILISASTDKLPEHLYNQLSSKGILVAPVNNSIFQVKKQNNKLKVKEFPGFVFVPLKS